MLPDLLHEREERKVWGDGGYHSNDPYETNFIDHGQRNIFRKSRVATVRSKHSFLSTCSFQVLGGSAFKRRLTLCCSVLTVSTN
jgi:hypothetical protein